MRGNDVLTAAVAGMLVLGGCGADPVAPGPGAGTGPVPSTSSAAPPPCGDRSLADRRVTFPNEAGATLAGYLLGDGKAAVVLAAQASADSCSWLPYARELATAGYRVLPFDFTHAAGTTRVEGGTPSADVVAAAGFVRQRGAARVALVGASRGGTAVLIAGARITPPVDAVLSLSAPTRYAGESATGPVAQLRTPVLYLAAEGDTSFATDARTLHAATPGTARTVTIVPGRLHGHGFVLITADGAAEARAAIDGFLAARVPPG